MEDRYHPVNPAAGSLREYRGALWGTAALVALNVALALPLGAAKGPVQNAALVEKSISGPGDKLIDKGEGSDDILTELAAAPVASSELKKLRGGFRTRSGLEISVGFDFKTFLNGEMKVHNIFNVLGNGHKDRSGSSSPSKAPTVITIGNGKIPTSVTTSLPVTIATEAAKKAAPEVASVIDQASNIIPKTPSSTPSTGAQAAAPLSSGPAGVTPTVEPIVINEISSGKVTVVNEIGPGTTVINMIDNGKVNSILKNAADGVTIDHNTSLSVGLTSPDGLISSFRSGRFHGLQIEVSNVMRSALIGAIAR